MVKSIQVNETMEDIVFEGRNQSYGAFQLRRLYDRNMSRAMLSGIIFFLFIISSPHIIRMLKGYFPESKSDLSNREIMLSEPPPIDPVKPDPPKPPKLPPQPIKSQIQFVPPVVKIDKEVADDVPPPPTIDQLAKNIIAAKTVDGQDDGVDPSLILPAEPSVPVIEENNDEEKPFTWVEQMPSFPDGEKAMYNYIGKNLKFPQLAIDVGINGMVVVEFVVTKEGKIENAKVIHGIGGGCDQEALRVINNMPTWKPGKHNGKTVPVTFKIPIKFILQH